MSDKREEILHAARRLASQHGYDGMSISQVAKLTDVAKSTVMHHFATKGELHAAIIREPYRALARTLEALSGEAGEFENESELDRTLRFFEAFSVWLGKNPDHARLMLRLQLDDPARTQAGADRYWAGISKDVLQTIERGKKSGVILRDLDARLFLFNQCNLVLHFYATLELQRNWISAGRALSATETRRRFHNNLLRTIRSALTP